MISIVVATDRNRVIGRENKIPWRLKDDLVALRKLTLNQTVILGRKTYESMAWYYDRSGKEMPAQMYIVITHNTDYRVERHNAMIVHSVDEAISAAQQFGKDIFVIGGAGIFEALLPQTDRIYLTSVNTKAEGDVFFPELDMSQWQETAREHHQQDARNEFDYDVITLDKI